MEKFTEVDVMKMIKDLASSYADDNKAQGKMVQLLKGLAFSDDPKANEFMKALDAWTTTQSKKMSGKKEAVSVEITEEFSIPGTDIILEAGDKIQIKEAGGFKSQSIRAIRVWAANDFAKWWDDEVVAIENRYERNGVNTLIVGAGNAEAAGYVMNDMRIALQEEMGGQILLSWDPDY